MSTTFVATYEGHVVGRCVSNVRTYRYAVLATEMGKAPHVVAWCSRRDLAVKEQKRWRTYGYDVVEIIDVIEKLPLTGA